ncbi:MAG: hypothetical protein ACOH2F_10445 [Cellulomonas sp.]
MTNRLRQASVAAGGLAAAALVMALAVTVPVHTGWNVDFASFHPVIASWSPHVGPGTVPALVIGVAGVLVALDAARFLPWRNSRSRISMMPRSAKEAARVGEPARIQASPENCLPAPSDTTSPSRS